MFLVSEKEGPESPVPEGNAMHFGDPNWKLVCVWHKGCNDNPHQAHRFQWVKIPK